jgi:hypothetical protein
MFPFLFEGPPRAPEIFGLAGSCKKAYVRSERRCFRFQGKIAANTMTDFGRLNAGYAEQFQNKVSLDLYERAIISYLGII